MNKVDTYQALTDQITALLVSMVLTGLRLGAAKQAVISTASAARNIKG